MSIKGKIIFVTGGAGFIGSHTVQVLAKRNKVIIYDNFSSSVITARALRQLSDNIRVIQGDILDEKKLGRAMKGADIVFHFAVACVRMSLSDASHVHAVNATGTLSTLLAAKQVKVARYIYISSSESYGSVQSGLIKENHEHDPTTVYGMSKYMGELYAQHFFRHEGLATIIVRPFNTYGPRSHFDGVYGEVIPRFCIRALNGKQPIIFGSGKQTRDFTYIEDTVRGIIMAACCDKLIGDTINIAYGKEVSINSVARSICAQTGIAFKPIMRPPRPNDVMRHAADISKAKHLLSYAPRVSINDGLTQYISHLQSSTPDIRSLLRHIPTTNW